MTSIITPEEFARLSAPFPLSVHSMREGNKVRDGKGIQWFTYMDRSEVENRLTEVFGAEWGTTLPVITPLSGDAVSATIGITIRGIMRADTGEDKNTDGERSKSATTDAFRRAGARWGIAKYLYEMDFRIYTDAYPKGDWKAKEAAEKEAMAKFTEWYNKKFKGAGVTPLNSHQEGVTGVSSPANVQSTTQTQSNAETAKSKLGTPAKQTIAPRAGKWAFDRNALLTQIAPFVGSTSYQERNATVRKMDEEGAFAECADIGEAVQKTLARLATHKKVEATG